MHLIPMKQKDTNGCTQRSALQEFKFSHEYNAVLMYDTANQLPEGFNVQSFQYSMNADSIPARCQCYNFISSSLKEMIQTLNAYLSVHHVCVFDLERVSLWSISGCLICVLQFQKTQKKLSHHQRKD